MNDHDFSELYAIGGPVIEQHIREIIENHDIIPSTHIE
jgi:hypothetical protein